MNGWWNKLYLFKDGLFPKGDRILYFDLDTVITGRLDEIASYDGNFAILRDWLEPEIVNSSVMAWQAIDSACTRPSANCIRYCWSGSKPKVYLTSEGRKLAAGAVGLDEEFVVLLEEAGMDAEVVETGIVEVAQHRSDRGV